MEILEKQKRGKASASNMDLMKNFKQINNITGWAVFLVALIVYTITLEETASFWDCGEFIAVSYKLMVPHPPGTPFFQLINRMFSFLALGDVTRVAFWINFSSAFFSALTILFLHWTIVLLGMKIIKPANGKEYSTGQIITLMGAGAVGALAYTFSDSFWFSAVEAEVYAMSSFLTAAIIWAILKWERIEKAAIANRWLILIAYIIGLSMGVHLLNLVVLPAMAMIFYNKHYPEGNLKGLVVAIGIGGILILVFMFGVIQGLPEITFGFDKFFVNTLGMPFSTGGIFFAILLLGGVAYGIYYSQVHGKVTMNNIFLGLAFVLIGYSSYTLLLIRSNQETPINENAPDDLLSFVSYLKREQYGDRPLLYGRNFTAQPTETKQVGDKYRQATKNGKDYYEVYDHKVKQIYDRKDEMLLPRMYSKQPGHDRLYQEKTGLQQGEKPTMGDNLYFMFDYQLGHMYARYFMWNFAGRQSDYKDAGWSAPWDAFAADLPGVLENNKARTNFFMLPLLLGLLGLFFQQTKDQKSFLVMLMIFFLTGVALVLYLNSPPVEPRERDYIYVGSFYVFAIWIGMGVMAISELLQSKAKGVTAPAIATALCMVVPVLMGTSGWESHNRSNRFHSIDQARNTLASCAPNAILFTGGDNDTFPLWYVQNVEGYRTDVRVAVLSYFSTGWYLEQMRQQQYESAPLPLGLDQENYREGKNEYIPLVPDDRAKGGVNLSAYLSLVNQNSPAVQVPLSDGTRTAMLLSDTFVLDVDSSGVINQGFIPKGKEDQVVSKMVWKLGRGKRHIFKNELALLDLISNNKNWERPIYFNNTSANTLSMDLRRYMMLEGMTYRLMPIITENTGDVGEVNTDVMLENIKHFQFREMNNTDVYYDDEYRKFGANTRYNFYRLAEDLYLKDREAEAKQVMDSVLYHIPDNTIPYSFYAPRYADLYHRLGDHKMADSIANTVAERAKETIVYYLNHNSADESVQSLAQRSMVTLQQLSMMYKSNAEEAQQKVKMLKERGQEILELPETQLMQEIKRNEELIHIYHERANKYGQIYAEVYGDMYGR
ncbi:DUF2723 domain-containing protein [Limibacter armeniacum]|uniref:glycosyltransferase family 117 protein n=1 Tax=Limibacter armeniacum TaxID=466084 RepID=UPI002FE55672